MSRSHDERLQDVRVEGVLLSSANNRALNPTMSASNLDKDKHEKQLLGKINSGNEPSGYRAVDLIKPSNKQLSNSMTHISVGSAPLPPMPPLQAPLLTSILPGPGHPLMPPGLSHAPQLRGATLSAQIPLMGRAAAAVAPPRASIVSPSLRASSIPLLKSTNNQNQIQISGKGSSIFSPIVPSNRAQSSSPGSNLSRPNEHTRDAKITHIQSEMHHIRGHNNTSTVTQISGTATVQVIASGTASMAYPVLSQSKPSIPNPNVLKIGSSNVQHGQPASSHNSNAVTTIVTTYKTAVPPNSITISKIFPQPILIPSTTSGTPSTTRPELQDHQKIISSNASHGRHTPPVSSSHHSSYASHHHYGINVSSYSSSHPSHLPFTTTASMENKNDRLKPGNQMLQYTIGSYYPIDPSFPHHIGVHALTPSSQYVHRYVQSIPGTNSGSFPLYVEGARGFTAPLPIPGMTAPTRDSHHHSSGGDSSTMMNNNFNLHNFPNLQPSNYHGSAPISNTSSGRSGPGILRKRAADGYSVHGIDRISSPTKQDVRPENRPESLPLSRPDNLPTRQESPRLLCDEKSTYNETYISAADSSLNSNNSALSSSITEVKREQDSQPTPPPAQLSTSHQNFISSFVTSGPPAEASPRKKPRKQNVITTEDKYSSKVSIEEHDIEMESKRQEKRKEIKKEVPLIKIQKPILPKLRVENNIETKVEPEQTELDETSKYYTFIRKPKSNVLGDYKINTKAAFHHFYRYSDVKVKEEKKPSSAELANNKKILQSISGWRVHHMSSQMDDLCALESEVCNKLFEFQRELPRPNKHYMMTAACHDIQNGRKSATVDEQLRVLHELIQGNIQRCQLSMEQISEAKQTMLRVLDHKPKILEIIRRHKHKRTSKKKMPSSSSS